MNPVFEAIVIGHIVAAIRLKEKVILKQWKKWYPELYERAKEIA